MALRDGETLVVATDVPRTGECQTESPEWLADLLERAMLTHLVADIAAEHFPRCSVLFLPFLNTGGHGTEPDSTTTAKMRRAGVLLGLTTYSLSHTNAREAVTRTGGRVSLASTIWQRRTLKASDEHKPSSSCLRSSSVRLRTYTGFLMPSIIPLSQISCLNLHQGKTVLS